MPYATMQDLEHAAGGAHKLVELADLDHDGVVDGAAIAAAQAKADGLIDSYAAQRYAVPIASPSAILVQHAADEAVFQLRLRRENVTERDVQERALRLQWLESLSQGKVRPSDPTPAKSSAVVNRYAPSDRAVSRAGLKGFW